MSAIGRSDLLDIHVQHKVDYDSDYVRLMLCSLRHQNLKTLMKVMEK